MVLIVTCELQHATLTTVYLVTMLMLWLNVLAIVIFTTIRQKVQIKCQLAFVLKVYLHVKSIVLGCAPKVVLLSAT